MRVQDILDAIGAIQQYTAGMDFAAFAADRKTFDAVVRNFTIIGEAANNVPEAVGTDNPEMPWHLMRGFRNVVVHVYFGVDIKIVWDTLRDDLPPLVPALRALLEKT